ncbi:MAG: SufD family Fe-S cluster assembly protein [Desulfurococcales archaeon]|nr:SufD family Fe-S cluster assembly protein [Desulfurococcales archaeon]MCE4627395.1 SufD family Fe-S cluster assembly protein [Desulfurococcales archaeon]MCE4629230.1 SufD family Fe-S cluster assembly protein [Desulfurococcales archaeon]
MALKEKYMEIAEKEVFQEIADSPTMKYYTNWKEFQKRLVAQDSRVYMELPDWVEKLSDKVVVLSDEVLVRGVPRDYIEVHDDSYDVLKDIKVTGKMEYYNAARLTRAVTIRIPREASLDGLVLVSLGGDGYTGHHIHIELEPFASAEVILVDLGGVGDSSIKTLTIAVDMDSDSRLKFYSISLHEEAAVYSRRVYRLSARSRLELNTFYSSGPATRINEDVYLNGEYSEIEVNSSSLAGRNKWGDVLLNVRHRGERSKSYINGRGVVLEDGILTIRGIAIVEKSAEWSSSHVEVHVSAFGEQAKGNASPMLEIHTGNVEEAFHSASVSSLSEDELFYLGTRGLSKDEARELLVEGILHFSGVLERLGLSIETVLRGLNHE